MRGLSVLLRRLAAAVCLMLSSSAFSVRGISFLHGKSTSCSKSPTRTTTATPSSSSASSTPPRQLPPQRPPSSVQGQNSEHSSTNSHHRKGLWSVLLPRGMIASSSSSSSSSSTRTATSTSNTTTTTSTTTAPLWATTAGNTTARATTTEMAVSHHSPQNHNTVFPSLASWAMATTLVATTATAVTSSLHNNVKEEQEKQKQQPQQSRNTSSSPSCSSATTTTATTTTTTELSSFTKSDPSTTTTTNADRPESVHLRLRQTLEPSYQHIDDNNNRQQNQQNQEEEKDPASKASPTKSNLKIHTYVDGRGRVWKALNIPRDKFEAFLTYHRVWTPNEVKTSSSSSSNNNSNNNVHNHGQVSPPPQQQRHIATQHTTTHVDAVTADARRKEWRTLWKKGQLITERTEYLAVYPSDQQQPTTASQDASANSTGEGRELQRHWAKRGGFADLLHLYTQRFLSFLHDEQEDKRSILRWLQKEYGRAATNRLRADTLNNYSPSEQMAYLKEFLEWFRTVFPYYYDRCSHCGASIREDVANHQSCDANEGADANKGHKTFLGYVYPAKTELKGKASRTELYRCHKCNSYTRFPRYNSAWHVMEHKRGRCGEYSMLLYRMLRVLDHEVRWVVDWADHVWVELFSERHGNWIHLDPCEAAVHENHLYQGWGKKQTYVLGFYAPREVTPDAIAETDHPSNNHHRWIAVHGTPLIEDITTSYTTDTLEEIQARRDGSESEVEAALAESLQKLRQRLVSGIYEDAAP